MAGIYIHIPFCRQACYYCNFHYSVSLKNKDEFINCLLEEIKLQKDFLEPFTEKTKNNKLLIDTLYFGGGTPSILEVSELIKILKQINEYYELKEDAEVTLEANPDDLTIEKLLAIKQTSVNRLSIGIQSFEYPELKYLNRLHSPAQSLQSIKNAYKAGFENISADLIYGIPTLTHEKWQENLETLANYNVHHISPYCLTVEPKTPLNVFIKRQQAENVDENHASEQFEMMIDILEKHGYEHYEISNFGKPGYFSKHNLSYWEETPYLGLGPSAHSYNCKIRQWNVRNTSEYINNIKKGHVPCEKEPISTKTGFNEYIMTSLRTQWGCNKNKISKQFGQPLLEHFNKESSSYIKNGSLMEKGDYVILTNKGKLLADKIASDLFA